MASSSLNRASEEERGLLSSTSFEHEAEETSEQSYNDDSRWREDWPDVRRGWKKVSAWPRFRRSCIGFAAALTVVSIILLLVILAHDEMVYRAQRHKINKAIALKINEEQMAKVIRPTNGTSNGYASVQSSATSTAVQPHRFEKPSGFKIIALVFYGRAPVVAVLDCYLKKNLVVNGGFLDEVHWAVNTANQEDLDFLDKLVETADSYKKILIPGSGYNNIWEHAVEPEHMYIKIDDDIVRPLCMIDRWVLTFI